VLLLPENDFVAVFPQVLVTEDDEAIKVHNMDVGKACDVPKLSYRRRWQTVDVDGFFFSKGCGWLSRSSARSSIQTSSDWVSRWTGRQREHVGPWTMDFRCRLDLNWIIC
jgi:hypothetical protein